MSTLSGNPLSQYGSGAYGQQPIEQLGMQYYLSLLTSEYRNSPKLNALLRLLLQKYQDISNTQAVLDMAFDLDNAIGNQLDFLGVIVGVSRQMRQPVQVGTVTYTSFPDYAYRLLLKLQIAQNSWDGTEPGIYLVWNTVLGSLGYGLLVADFQDMSMAYVFLNPPTDPLLLAILTQGYFNLKPAGVNLLGYYTPSVPGTPIFSWNIENQKFEGWNQGCWLVPLGQGYGQAGYGTSPYGGSGSGTGGFGGVPFGGPSYGGGDD
jgi:hypothetical protein